MYSDEQRDQLEVDFHLWRDRTQELVAVLAHRPFRTVEGVEYGRHGLARRLATLRHCSEMVFEALPLDQGNPSREDRLDATVGLQSFCLNVVGAMDNLARLWMFESGALEGVCVSRTQIGLGPKHTVIRQSLPEEFQIYLEQFDVWFAYILEYRHALAHRIPLYIPPRSYRPHEVEEVGRLDREIWDAAIAMKADRLEELEQQRNQIGSFDATMMHSFEENAQPMRLHPQMLCDLSTVVDIAEHLVPLLPHP